MTVPKRKRGPLHNHHSPLRQKNVCSYSIFSPRHLSDHVNQLPPAGHPSASLTHGIQSSRKLDGPTCGVGGRRWSSEPGWWSRHAPRSHRTQPWATGYSHTNTHTLFTTTYVNIPTDRKEEAWDRPRPLAGWPLAESDALIPVTFFHKIKRPLRPRECSEETANRIQSVMITVVFIIIITFKGRRPAEGVFDWNIACAKKVCRLYPIFYVIIESVTLSKYSFIVHFDVNKPDLNPSLCKS